MSDDPKELVRVLACDLAEHVVEREGRARGFAVWVDDGDVQSFTEPAQDLFNRVSDRIERELFAYVDDHADDAAVIDALTDVAEENVVRSVLARLPRRH